MVVVVEKKEKVKRDPLLPPRPMTAYQCYKRAHGVQGKKRDADGNVKWADLKDRRAYEEMARRDRERYEAQMQLYDVSKSIKEYLSQ